ncbi:virulence associated lipoprotein [Borreliella valaisiana]|uniref:virulence associated lipoprotein n=1 Tax=Borreliella valaisiana TaxID=62088 RepID=UPI002ED154C9|nr:virulence associated lipoprotein [Borreliella valaisiana]WVN14540.1 virulence associated lipoprotein [Borreliella valaisiana]
MKYYVIVNIFLFLFLNACTPDFSTNRKNLNPSNKTKMKPSTKIIPNQKEKKVEEQEVEEQEVEEEQEDINQKTLLNDLINLIEEANAKKEKYIKKMAEEPSDQYGMLAFDDLGWGKGTESISDNTQRSIRYRRHTYTLLSLIDDNELKEFSNIIMITNKTNSLLSNFSNLGGVLDVVTDRLYPKKSNLDKLNTSDLEKIKESFEKILSIIKSVSETSKQILLDYQNNKNLIKTDVEKLKSYLDILCNQMRKKAMEAEKLQKIILSIKNL